jgi:hypothetical protein
MPGSRTNPRCADQWDTGLDEARDEFIVRVQAHRITGECRAK